MAEYNERLHVFKVRAGPTKFDANAFEKIVKRRQANPKILENEKIAKAVMAKVKSADVKPKENAASIFKVALIPVEADSHPLDFEGEYAASFSAGKPQKSVPTSRKGIPKKATAFSRNLSSNIPIENLRQYHMPYRRGRPKELNRFVRDNPLLSKASDFVNRLELDLSNQSHLNRLESLLAFEFGKNALTGRGIETAQEPKSKTPARKNEWETLLKKK